MQSNKKKLRILSYNVGLLRFRLCGINALTVFSNPSFAEERFPHICQQLLNFDDVDIICIQECYEHTHIKKLAEILKIKYPYYAYKSSGFRIIKFNNGLVIFSKHEIEDTELTKLNKVATVEKYLASKSNLNCTISVPNIGRFTIINIHTTAGGTTHPEDSNTDLDRESELLQSFETCKNAIQNNCIPLICGDFNCGPEASFGNFEFILKKGFRDTYAEYYSTINNNNNDSITTTWDPKNYLNTIGVHAHCPAQRCDHILVPTIENFPSPNNHHFKCDWIVSKADIVFIEPCVDVGNNIKSTLSDHYGLLIELQEN